MMHRDQYWAKAEEAAKFIAAQGMSPVDAVFQCGSGLHPIEETLAPGGSRVRIGEVPNLPAIGVAGHGNELVYGEAGGKRVLIFAGRFHMYEGHSPLTAGLPAAVAKALGAKLFLLSNAAGGLNQHFATGDVMLHSDYINFQGDNALAHMKCDDAAEKFVDPKPPYDLTRAAALARYLKGGDMRVHQGTYIGVQGPIYETRAELAMMRSWGADAIGMSTIPEVMIANFFKLPVVGMSVITNECFDPAPVSHSEVVENSRRAALSIGGALKAYFEQGWQD